MASRRNRCCSILTRKMCPVSLPSTIFGWWLSAVRREWGSVCGITPEKNVALSPADSGIPLKKNIACPATYTRYETPKVVKMPDILGAILDEPMQGFVSFELNGKEYELVVEELPDHRLFIQFMDLTNGNTTYPSGRYHYTDAHENGKAVHRFQQGLQSSLRLHRVCHLYLPAAGKSFEGRDRSGRDVPGHHSHDYKANGMAVLTASNA